jgi:hypothetical protein
VVWGRAAKRVVPMAWANFRLIDYKDRIRSGIHTLKLWYGKPDPLAPCLQSDYPSSVRLSFEIEVFSQALYYPPLSVAPQPPPLPLYTHPYSQDSQKKLESVLHSSPLYRPTTEERKLMWEFRGYCFKNPRSIAKWAWSIPWGSVEGRKEAYAMIDHWKEVPEAREALELLKPRFFDRKLREYSVKALDRLSDSELQSILLQLVQALKAELHLDSPLARFLLKRALSDKFGLGHQLFWFMKVELRDDSSDRYHLLLEAYLRLCGPFREDFLKQSAMNNQMSHLASYLKALSDKKKRPHLVEQTLKSIKLAQQPAIIHPSLRLKSIITDRCKFMDSKTVREREREFKNFFFFFSSSFFLHSFRCGWCSRMLTLLATLFMQCSKLETICDKTSSLCK